jgi:heavy metal sensor kinase
MFNSVRLRLTFWSVLIFAMLLIAFSGWLYWLIAREMDARFDHTITDKVLTAAAGFQGQMLENHGDAKVATAHTFVEFRPLHTYLAVLTEHEILSANYFDQQSRLSSEITVALPPAAVLATAKLSEKPILQTIHTFGTEGGRMAITHLNEAGTDYFIVVAESREDVIAQLRGLRRIFYISLPTMLLIAAIAGSFLARKSLAPVAAMSAQAEQINANNLHERLQVRNQHDELGRLATVFNSLLARVNGSFDGLRKFTADASHELRTPLAIIRGEADVALSQLRTPHEYQETIGIVRDEATRLSRIVDDMLSLARADASEHKLLYTEIYLNDLVEECCRAVQTLAVSKNITVTFTYDEDTEFSGDEDLLRRMILNLLDNAIKYTPQGGIVRVKLTDEPEQIQICVSDNGIGIPAEAAAHVFDRFYRVDKTRTRTEGGSGLGLPIVKWVAEAHHGNVTLTSNPGLGSEFIVTLPRKE